jgi:DNA helicase HerA-like ATPase
MTDTIKNAVLIAKNSQTECHILGDKANRHGLITGATGTGKTVTLQTMAEGFSRLGVPVFMADIKGDLTGVSQTGNMQAKMAVMLRSRDIDCPTPRAFPVTLWDVFGDKGHPVRATISDLGCCCRACSTLTTYKPVCCS